ncbi:leucine zipper putative tumor suppressor 3-like [Salvelinus sp. IW2-2015]|uniref:leucine zipper putative tumor suppressor 3-like n=1 Tax=Salvelinus sp. IW2-2015 TaxID=2691554 RepID=UPI0038D51900
MGSVGSGVAGEQEFAMKSVGTRTTLPRAPALSRHCPADRSCRTERLPPETVSEGTASSDERGSVSIGTGTGNGTGTDRPPDSDTDHTTTTASNCDQEDPWVGCGNGAGRREREWERERKSRRREMESKEMERERVWERERERVERERERERVERDGERERVEVERERDRVECERKTQGGFVSLDVCSNVVGLGGNDSGTGMTPHQHRETGENKTDNHNNPLTHNPPKILPVSGKLEQNNSGLVRPSAFKPVVPKSFHSMQNLLGPTSGSGGEGRGGGGQRERGAGGGELVAVPEALLLDQDSPGRGRCLAEGAGGGKGNGGIHGGMSDSGRNSLTSLPTYAGSGLGYGPQEALGSLSASTSNINRLGTTAGAAVALEKLEQPGYQNGLSASYSDRSSSVKSSSSYQQLNHLGDTPAPQHPAPSSSDVIQDLENRLWEKQQEVQHMRRNLEQSEAAIVQVFEEKQRVWERQMDELGQNYASRLQQMTRRAQRSQNALQAQITHLSQDKRRLQEEMAALLAQREDLERKCLHFRMEQTDILPRLDETKWEVCQKAGEISLLKQQLRESQAEVTQRAGEMVALRGQLKEANAQLRDREEAMLGLKNSYSSKSLELERCQGELRRTLTEVSILREKLGVFEAEVLGLKQALWEMGGGVDPAITQTPGAVGLLPPWGALYCPHTPPEPSSTPLSPTSDALLSLQSDEAKAQRQEVQRQERQQREEAQWRDMQQCQEAHQRLKAHLYQEAHLHQEAQLRKEPRLHQWAHLCQEAHFHQEAQLKCQEAQVESGNLREQLDQLQGALRLERQQRERQTLSFDQERHTWIDEKERVLKYQAQLQVSYVETLQKNQALEQQVGQLGSKPTPTPSSSSSPPPPPTLSTFPPLPSVPLPAPIALTLSPPPCEDVKGSPSLLQLPTPWAGPSRLERIESTEI